MNQIRFKHDGCPACRFVGQRGNEDIWLCQETLMRRYSDEPSDYQSADLTIVPAIAQSAVGLKERVAWLMALDMARAAA